MRYFIPRLQYGAFSPPQTALQDKFGGLPWGLPVSRWPVCSNCKEHQTLIAQLVHHDDRLNLGRGGRVLHVFQCGYRLGKTCAAWEPGSGANACFLLDGDQLGTGLTTHPSDVPAAPESQVIEWVAKEDGIDPKLAPVFLRDSSWSALDEGIHERVYSGTKCGSVPCWAQAPPDEIAGWRFLLQIRPNLKLEGPPPTPNEVGCMVMRLAGDSFVGEDHPRTRKPGAPENVVHHVQENMWSYPFTNYGEGNGYVFTRAGGETMEGLYLWQR